MRPIALSILLLSVLLLLSAATAVGEPTKWADYERAVKEKLKAEDPVQRARAFDGLHECADPRAVELIIKSVKAIQADQTRIRKDQADIEKAYEEQFSKKVKADQWFENSTRSAKDMDRYNKAVKKISKKLGLLRKQQRNLENDFTRAKAQMDGGVRAMAKVLQNIPTEELSAALQTIQTYWRDAKALEDKMRWLDSIADVDRPLIQETIRDAVKMATLPVEVRAAALETLGARKAPGVFELASPYLEAGSNWDMTAGAIQVMRLIHEKRAIPAVIDFLNREDIKRLRDDAHAALKSLTGLKHGPYYDPWAKWWEDQGDLFQMPEKPVSGGDPSEEQAGVTFYGIHTFSDRILFILDVSGSMDQAPKAGPDGGEQQQKIAAARKELIGAIDGMNDGDRFNVLFFNHQVVPWQGKMAEASNSTRRRAKKWINDQAPQGGTNIHDALEAGFGMALRATGEPLLDTIYFLTDGKPTAGKIQDAAKILEEVEQWNRTARLTIHVVGLRGDPKHPPDEVFLQALANLGKGKFVLR
jgi:predicted  nucleic acid-binding Zn-ribbon protein